MKRFILASASPRRKEILENAGFTFDIIVSDVDENITEDLSPSETVEELAKRKALAADVPIINGSGNIMSAYGTSFAAPAITGSIAVKKSF